RGRGVDREDASVRPRRADDAHVQLVREREVTDEAAAPGHQRGVFEARNGRAKYVLPAGFCLMVEHWLRSTGPTRGTIGATAAETAPRPATGGGRRPARGHSAGMPRACADCSR